MAIPTENHRCFTVVVSDSRHNVLQCICSHPLSPQLHLLSTSEGQRMQLLQGDSIGDRRINVNNCHSSFLVAVVDEMAIDLQIGNNVFNPSATPSNPVQHVCWFCGIRWLFSSAASSSNPKHNHLELSK